VKYIAIAVGGMAGALLRYGVSGFTYKFVNGMFPWGTLAVNLSGCFVMGLLWAASERVVLPASFKPFVFVGILGAFTTFSTFALETFQLLRDREIKIALLNILASNVLGIIMLFAGFLLAGVLLRKG